MSWRLKQRQKNWLAQEKGTIVKDWGGKFRIALAFPNRYAVGMSNLGFQSVYGLLNEHGNIVCERVFYPETEDLKELRLNPGQLLSVESQRPIQDFHLLAFSIPFENDYSNVVEMLSLAGIPPQSRDRKSNHPLVAAGGVAVFLNPEPLADFIDFMLIGEAEAIVPDLLQCLDVHADGKLERRDLLTVLAREVEGLYAPSLYEVLYKPDGTVESLKPFLGKNLPEKIAYRRTDLDGTPPCRSVILTPNTEFSSVNLIEIGRGCGRGCRFCAAGFVYRPVRYHAADKLATALDDKMAAMARVGLVSAAVSDHPEIADLCRALMDKGASLSFSSLRADTIDAQIRSALESSRHKAVAIAPEAGSDRLRRVINKNLSLEQIYEAAEKLTEIGILNLKLYFMIGLPSEDFKDLEAIVDVAKGIKHHVLKISRGQKRLGTITLSIHSFVPKAFTPFQWVPFSGVQELKKRAKWIQRALQKVPNVRVHFDLPKWAYVQALLARGDRRVGAFLEKVAIDRLSWTQAMRVVPFNPDFWVMRERGETEIFPWEIVDHGIKRAFLWEEYQRALLEKSSPPCPADGKCRRCGVCEP
ncbi:MAG: radical SAM protein [Desulfoferrobacter sp.]